MKKLLLLTPLFLLCALTYAQTAKPKVKVMQLKDVRFKYAPQDYHISDVVDDREDTSGIGFVKLGLSDQPATLKLSGGTAYAIGELLFNNLKQNSNTEPIELHISTMDVSEKRVSGMDKAEIEMVFTFYISGEKTISLSSTADLTSGSDVTGHIEEMIRKQTESALKQFGEWWKKNKKDFTAKPGITVKVSIDKKPRDNDYLPYSSTSRLTYSDFQAAPDELSRGAAATASAVSMSAGSMTRGNQVELDIRIGAFFDKRHSWFKKDAMNAKVLAHEQLHFDITTYKACELIQILGHYKFSPANYEDELQELKKRNEQETESMQNQYDLESNHGLNRQKQIEWEEYVKKLLSQQDCFE